MDSTAIDSAGKYEVPRIISFIKTSSTDSVLGRVEIITPIFFINGFQEITRFTPYIIKERADASYLHTPYPLELKLHCHGLDDYFLNQFNLFLLPLHFFSSVKFQRHPRLGSSHSLELLNKVNVYDRPFSSIYFTLLSKNSTYNFDFARALNADIGFYLGGLYSYLYRMSEDNYLRTQAGSANLYYNQFLPSRVDILVLKNDYGTLTSTNFVDLAVTAGLGGYRIMVHHTADYSKYLDTLVNHTYLNDLKSYGIDQCIYFPFMKTENTIGFNVRLSGFKYDTVSVYDNRGLILYHEFSHTHSRFKAGIGYYLGYRVKDNIYFSPKANLSCAISKDFEMFLLTGLLHKQADFVSEYGNDNFVYRELKIKGNPDIRDESRFHKEIGLRIKNSSIIFYHLTTAQQIALRRDSADFYSAYNIPENTIYGIEFLAELCPLKGVLLGTASSYLIEPGQFSVFPRENFKFILGWNRITARSVIRMVSYWHYYGKRKDVAGNQHEQVWIISPGISIKFLTLSASMLFDNILDTKLIDFPETRRKFGAEVKWEFWD